MIRFMNLTLLFDLIGWLGAVAVIAAYALVSSKKLDGVSFRYQLLNFFGGVFLIINTVFYHAYPSTLVNAIWIGIAVWTMYRQRRKVSKLEER
jgi:uncharacterized membrane protein